VLNRTEKSTAETLERVRQLIVSPEGRGSPISVIELVISKSAERKIAAAYGNKAVGGRMPVRTKTDRPRKIRRTYSSSSKGEQQVLRIGSPAENGGSKGRRNGVPRVGGK